MDTWASANPIQIAGSSLYLGIDQDSNAHSVSIGTKTIPSANGLKVLSFGDNGATNPTMGSNTAGIFAKDVSGTVETFAADEAGNVTQLSSHNPLNGEYYHYSTNSKTGKKLVIDLEQFFKHYDEENDTDFMSLTYEKPEPDNEDTFVDKTYVRVKKETLREKIDNIVSKQQKQIDFLMSKVNISPDNQKVNISPDNQYECSPVKAVQELSDIVNKQQKQIDRQQKQIDILKSPSKETNSSNTSQI